VIQYLGDTRGLSASVPLIAYKGDYGLTTTASTNAKGEIQVEQTIKVRTFLPESEKAVGDKSELYKIESKVVNDYRDKVEITADLAAKNLARDGFKDPQSAKKAVEESTKKIIDKAAFELKLEHDTFHRTK
jgi:hypothetical protein